MFYQPVPAFHRFARLDRVAVLINGGTGLQVAIRVRIDLKELGREGMREIVQNILPWRDVHGEIVPFRCRNLGEPSLQQGLVGRDDLNNRGMPRVHVALNRLDQARHLHRRDQVIEEALLVRFKR